MQAEDMFCTSKLYIFLDVGMGLLVQSLYNMSCLHTVAVPSLHLVSVVIGTAIPTFLENTFLCPCCLAQ